MIVRDYLEKQAIERPNKVAILFQRREDHFLRSQYPVQSISQSAPQCWDQKRGSRCPPLSELS